jgi:O-antigen/teichoic acid export membrane protein
MKTALAANGLSDVRRRAARGTLQLMIGRMLFFVSGYLVTVILARGLGPVEYGVYGLILSILLWIEQIGDFGIPEAAAKLIPEDADRAATVQKTTQTLLAIVFLLLFVFAWLACPAFTRLFDIPEGTGLFRVAILDIPFTGIYFAYQGILTGHRNFRAISGGLAVYGLTKLFGISIALLLGLSIFSALIVNIIGTIGGLLFLAIYISPKLCRPSLGHSRIILHLAFPIALLILASQILWNLDLWSLKLIGSERAEIIGMYVAALNLARVPAFAFCAVNGVILPSLSMAVAQQDAAMMRRYVQGAGRFLWVTLLPSCSLVALTAEDLMRLVFSDLYSRGASFLVLQVFAFALLGVAHAFGEMLVARGSPYSVARIALVHIPLALVLNLTLIPHLGALGAATAFALTALSLTSITGFLVFRRLGSVVEASTFVRVVLATALMALVSLQIPWSGPWLLVKYSVLLSVYGLALIVLGELKRDDLKLLDWRRAEEEKVGFSAR